MGTHIEVLTSVVAVEVVNDVLRVKRVGMESASADTTLESLTLDSLDLVEVLAALEDRCGRALNVDLVTELVTVADLGRL